MMKKRDGGRVSDRIAIMTGRCLAEARWATTPPAKRPPIWGDDREGIAFARIEPGIPERSRYVRSLIRRGAEERWLELRDAHERMRVELSSIP